MNLRKEINLSIFTLYQLSRSRNFFKNIDYLERSQWMSISEINQIQWHKLKELIQYSYEYVPYYREKLDSLNVSPNDINSPKDLSKLPLLTKEDIELNIKKIISSIYDLKDLINNSTGGSTGRNLSFFVGKDCSDIRAAIAFRGNKFAGLDICEKHAYLWGSPFDVSLQNKITNKISNKIMGCDLFLSSYDLSDKNMIHYAELLLKHNPKVIIGYPSPLYTFATFLQRNNICGIHPQSIISSSEVLYDFQRELIEDIFNCKIFNRYGSREFGMIAQECSEHSGLHINSEHVYVECLKENGEPAELDEEGELIITDLDNYGMPFIRYRIGDRGIISNVSCNCGRGLPILKKVEGRTFDIIVGINGKRVGGTFWTILFRTAVDGIEQFQVVQEHKNELNVRIVVNKLFKKEYLDFLTKKIIDTCGKDMKVNFEIVDEIPLTKSGKFRFIISKYSSFGDNLGDIV